MGETMKNIAPYIVLLIAGVITFMKVKSSNENAVKSINKVEVKMKEQDEKIEAQDRGLIKMSGKIDLVLSKLEPLARLDEIIEKKVKSEMDSRELENLKS